MGGDGALGTFRRPAGEHQHVVDELAHAPDLTRDHLRLGLGRFAASALQDLGCGEYRHQRVPQLVPELTDLAQSLVFVDHSPQA